MAVKRIANNSKTEVEEVIVAPELPEVVDTSVKLQAVFNRMLNPHTGAVYRVGMSTDLNDLTAPESKFERAQLNAGTLRKV